MWHHVSIVKLIIIIIIRFCALAGYGWSKWRGQELWGNCDGQKGRSKVILSHSLSDLFVYQKGSSKAISLLLVFGFLCGSVEGAMPCQVTTSQSLATLLQVDYSTV